MTTPTTTTTPLADARVRFFHDYDTPITEIDGLPMPLTEAQYAEHGPCLRADRSVIPYAEYCRYYGDPNQHVMVAMVLEHRCPCCDHWHETDHALYGIDVMIDDPALALIQRTRGDFWSDRGVRLAAVDALALPGYLGTVARDLLSEANVPLPETPTSATDADEAHA